MLLAPNTLTLANSVCYISSTDTASCNGQLKLPIKRTESSCSGGVTSNIIKEVRPSDEARVMRVNMVDAYEDTIKYKVPSVLCISSAKATRRSEWVVAEIFLGPSLDPLYSRQLPRPS